MILTPMHKYQQYCSNVTIKNCKKGQCDRLAALVSCNSITKRSIGSNLNKNAFECEARNKADARKYHMEDTRNKLRC